MPAPFDLPFVQRGVLEIVAIALAAGLLGTWIVLRGLAFYAHAVGTAAFPGLVLADGLGFSASLGAFTTAAIVAGSVGWLSRRDRESYDSLTAIVLVGALAAGVLLASDVFRSGAHVETLLFGSLLVVDRGDVALAAVASGLVLLASLTLGPRWLATGFDSGSARALGVRSSLPDAVLLALVALTAVAALSAIGALLTTALIVVPAATTRLVIRRMATWQAATVALVVAEGTAGLWISVELNAPPGATIAVIAGALFACVAVGRVLVATRRARPALGAVALLVALGVAGCGSGSNAGGAGGRVRVVATTTQLADFARQAGGDAVDVTQILKPNSDAHEYEPRPDDVRETAGADIVFLNGDNLDRWMGDVVKQAGGDPRVVDLGAVVPVRLPGEKDGPEASTFDPHWWHDPRNARAAVEALRDALVRAAPSRRTRIEASAGAYLSRLGRLDRGIARCFASVPASERKLVTDHDAFNYLARRYGITVVGAVIPSQTTQAQPSAGELSALSATIRREHVTAVFPESSLSPRLARAIARQTGASAGNTLYGDSLGPKGSSGATYLAMEEANANELVRGFTGGARGCTIAEP